MQLGPTAPRITSGSDTHILPGTQLSPHDPGCLCLPTTILVRQNPSLLPRMVQTPADPSLVSGLPPLCAQGPTAAGPPSLPQGSVLLKVFSSLDVLPNFPSELAPLPPPRPVSWPIPLLFSLTNKLLAPSMHPCSEPPPPRHQSHWAGGLSDQGLNVQIHETGTIIHGKGPLHAGGRPLTTGRDVHPQGGTHVHGTGTLVHGQESSLLVHAPVPRDEDKGKAPCS